MHSVHKPSWRLQGAHTVALIPLSVWQNANLSDVLMDRAVMNEANLRNANLQRTIFTRCARWPCPQAPALQCLACSCVFRQHMLLLGHTSRSLQVPDTRGPPELPCITCVHCYTMWASRSNAWVVLYQSSFSSLKTILVKPWIARMQERLGRC